MHAGSSTSGSRSNHYWYLLTSCACLLARASNLHLCEAAFVGSHQADGSKPSTSLHHGPSFVPSSHLKMASQADASVGVSIDICDKFDGGNIEFVKQEATAAADDAGSKDNSNDKISITVRVKPDPYTELETMEHMQYFSFKSTVGGLADGAGQDVEYIIDNASKVSYPSAWPGSTVFWTTDISDPNSWVRNVGTKYEDGKLIWTHPHAKNGEVYFSYFPSFTYEQHKALVAKCRASDAADVTVLGQSLDGRDIECIKAGSGDRICWIIHRQHPGEHMAEYYAEGLLTRLLLLDSGTDAAKDTEVEEVLSKYTFYIVPSMCPDGGVRGHLRTNACGANLNREWAPKGDYDAPTLKRSPEVYGVLNKMDETGVDMFLDVHGDEELPFNFLSGAELVPAWDRRMEGLHGAFVAAYSRANSDMQANVGYTPPATREESAKTLNIGSNQVANRFNCLGLTLEMPFKDCHSNPDPERGWSPARSRKLGASVLRPLLYIHPYLRDNSPFWETLPAADAYVKPSTSY